MPGRPNILLILSDEHRADCMGCYGNVDIRTPHIDALAFDGIRYRNSFCPYPMCTPSRYSLLTGLAVQDHRCRTNHCNPPPGTPYFPKLLRQNGYRTAAVGKMHFTPTYLDVGFERMMLAEQDGDGRWDDDYHRDLRDAGLVDLNDLEDQRAEYRAGARTEYWASLGALPSNLPARYHSTEWIAEKALGLLEDWGPQGNLLMVGFVKPHHPFDPPAEWCDAYNPDEFSLLPGWTSECLPRDLGVNRGYFPFESLTEESVRRAMAYYYATIEHMDAQIGRMIALLRRRGLYDDTLIVYTSDHGDYMGYHHMLLKGSYMYDPVVRVPLIVKYPGRRERGGESSALVSNIDLAPTLLRQAGVAPAAPMKGLDLAGGDERSIVFAEGQGGAEVMARTHRLKLLMTQDPEQTLLFDLGRDPQELTDRSTDVSYRDERQRLEDALKSWRGAGPLSETHLDENAPTIHGPNVPPRDGSHRAEMEEYFAAGMGAMRRGS